MDKDLRQLTDEVDAAAKNLQFRTHVAGKRLRALRPAIVVEDAEYPAKTVYAKLSPEPGDA